jgi:cystathionine beta-lyase
VTNPLELLTLEQLRRRTSAKWRTFDADVLPLWVAEMDVPLAPAVAAALREAIAIGDSGYPSGNRYAQALAVFAAERWDWSFEETASVPVADVMGGIGGLLRVVTAPGDGVVINSPVYPPFYGFVELNGRRVIEAPLGEDHRIDAGALEAAFAQATSGGSSAAFLLCSPHNPTGTVHTREELETVARLAADYGVRVLVDEIHAPLVYSEAVHVPYLSVAGSERAFALLSASKAWNLAGVKAALAVAGADAIDQLGRLDDGVRHGPSHLGVIAHAAALRDGGDWLDSVLAGLELNRRLLGELLAHELPGVLCQPPQGTYLAWLDCRALGLGDDPAEVFLERGRVALSPGPRFGSGGAGHARLNLATSSAILTEAVARMARAVR